MAAVPVEVWETITGMTVVSKRLTPDSGGPGAFRGGVGQEIVLRNDTGQPMTVLSMGNRTDFAPPGYLGGRPGGLRGHRINGETIHPKGAHPLAPGDEIALVQAGGGGIGDPTSRAPDAIARDIALGFVTPAGAARDYGFGPADDD